MPQARSTGSSTSKPTAKRTSAKSTAAKSSTAKPAAAKRTTGAASKTASGAAKTSSSRSTAARSTTASKAGAAGTAAKNGAAKTSSGSAAKSKPRVTIHVNTEGTQIEAIAERLRKLNERIIEVGREAGESTLGSYEKALKTFATGISKGPAKDELEWIQHLAASQAKFVREITDSVAKAARERLR